MIRPLRWLRRSSRSRDRCRSGNGCRGCGLDDNNRALCPRRRDIRFRHPKLLQYWSDRSRAKPAGLILLVFSVRGAGGIVIRVFPRHCRRSNGSERGFACMLTWPRAWTYERLAAPMSYAQPQIARLIGERLNGRTGRELPPVESGLPAVSNLPVKQAQQAARTE